MLVPVAAYLIAPPLLPVAEFPIKLQFLIIVLVLEASLALNAPPPLVAVLFIKLQFSTRVLLQPPCKSSAPPVPPA